MESGNAQGKKRMWGMYYRPISYKLTNKYEKKNEPDVSNHYGSFFYGRLTLPKKKRYIQFKFELRRKVTDSFLCGDRGLIKVRISLQVIFLMLTGKIKI